MSKHTALPWSMDKYGDVVHCAKGQVSLTGFALSCGPRNKESEANARLIVTAVNYHDRLREALDEVVRRVLSVVHPYPSEDAERYREEMELTELARTLLAELDNMEPKP